MDQVSFSGNQFASISSQPVNVVDHAGGIAMWVMGMLVTLKALANETGGSYSALEDTVPPGANPPFHTHTREDESWYMLDGELIWDVGSESFHARKGSFIHLPRFVPHRFVNKFDKPAHMISTYTPGGFDEYFLEFGDHVSDINSPGDPPPVTPEMVQKAIKLGQQYGVIFKGHEEKFDEVQ